MQKNIYIFEIISQLIHLYSINIYKCNVFNNRFRTSHINRPRNTQTYLSPNNGAQNRYATIIIMGDINRHFLADVRLFPDQGCLDQGGHREPHGNRRRDDVQGLRRDRSLLAGGQAPPSRRRPHPEPHNKKK